jgi:DNA-directed RNA polymerase specialized sigma24 family protein
VDDSELTSVVARVCLDAVRSRASGSEEPAQLADSVSAALLVVLDTLAPAERLAFVLHDLFAVPFDEIAPIVGRTPAAARRLASRARRRISGESTVDGGGQHRWW